VNLPTAITTDGPTGRGTGARRFLCLALLALSAIGLWVHMRRFAFVTDDAFISFVYARNLAEHGELVFNLDERVEGYTNFLWTVFLAGWMKLGWQPESSSIFWGVLCALGTMLVCSRLVYQAHRPPDDTTAASGPGPGNLRRPMWASPWEAVPALFLAALPGYACWSSGGLETQLFTLLVTLGSALHLGSREEEGPGPAAGLVFGLAALTRPEGNLFFALALAHRQVERWRTTGRFWPSRRELLSIACFLALVVPHFLWRHHYYGWWLPNTFYIKSSGGRGAWARGLYYLRRATEQHALWAPVVLMVLGSAATRARPVRRLLGYTALLTAVFALYVASVGGDFMGLFRFTLPVVPLLVTAGTVGLRAFLDRWRAPAPAAAGVVAALFAVHVWHAQAVDRAALAIGSDNGIDTPGYLRWYTRDRALIGQWFGRYAQPDDYAAVGGAGAQVYYSRMRSLDCFGLSDEHIAHKVPAASDRPGHQKYAPLEYQLSRRPTIITSNYYRIGPSPRCCPPVADEAAWRARGYHYVSVQIPGLSSPWYTFLKRMDRSLGPLGPVNGEID
jgi:arabinofuranosyltransferase